MALVGGLMGSEAARYIDGSDVDGVDANAMDDIVVLEWDGNDSGLREQWQAKKLTKWNDTMLVQLLLRRIQLSDMQ